MNTIHVLISLVMFQAFELLRDSPDVVNIMVERAVLASPRRSSMALPGALFEAPAI